MDYWHTKAHRWFLFTGTLSHVWIFPFVDSVISESWPPLFKFCSLYVTYEPLINFFVIKGYIVEWAIPHLSAEFAVNKTIKNQFVVSLLPLPQD